MADFIGQSNLIEATVGAQNGSLVDLHVVGGGGTHVLRARIPKPFAVSQGGAVLAVVRPEDVSITAANGQAASANMLPGRVADIEYLGEDTRIRVQVDGLPALLVSFKTTRAAQARIAGPDIALEIDASDVFIISR